MHLIPTLSKKRVPLAASVLLLCLVFSSFFTSRVMSMGMFPPQSFGSDPNLMPNGQANAWGAVPSKENRDYKFDNEVSESTKADRSRLSTFEFLERHGLRQIAEQLGEFIRLFDTSTHFLDHIEIDLLNSMISTFRDTFIDTVEESRRSMDKVSGSISLSAMREFLHRHEVNFQASLQAEPYFRKWASLLSQSHIVFDSLARVYQLCIEGGMPISWWMVQMVAPLASNIPDNLLDEAAFSEVLKLPVTLQSQLHDVLETVFTSGYGPVIKIAMQTLSNMAYPHGDEL